MPLGEQTGHIDPADFVGHLRHGVHLDSHPRRKFALLLIHLAKQHRDIPVVTGTLPPIQIGVL